MTGRKSSMFRKSADRALIGEVNNSRYGFDPPPCATCQLPNINVLVIWNGPVAVSTITYEELTFS